MIIFLSCINVICGLMHLLAEYILLNITNQYMNFLLIENILIAFVFIHMGYTLYKKNTLVGNLLFWIIFTMSVVIFKPTTTTLVVVEEYIPVEQWVVLLITGLVVIIINSTIILHKKNLVKR